MRTSCAIDVPATPAVVLVEPSLPENVGAVARVIANLGGGELRLVNPCDHLSFEALSLATHSAGILREARVFPSLAEALTDRQFVMGTSARRRERHARPLALPDLATVLPGAGGRLALVFGRESSGLTNDELALCHACVHVPTQGEASSMNLSHAVAVVLYELTGRTPAGAGEKQGQVPTATARELEGLKAHLLEVLDAVGFLKPGAEASIRQSFADLLGRAQPTDLDVRLLRGFLHRVQVTLQRAGVESRPGGTGPS
jgi:TrmH family RNA methyltransferase